MYITAGRLRQHITSLSNPQPLTKLSGVSTSTSPERLLSLHGHFKLSTDVHEESSLSSLTRSQWSTRSYSGPASVSLRPPPNLFRYLKADFLRRRRGARLATRHRDATILQHTISLGIPAVRRRGRELRMVDNGCGRETECSSVKAEGEFAGETEEESRKGREYGWRLFTLNFRLI